MTARDRLLIRVFVPLVAVAAFWLMALSPKLSDMRTASDNLATARSELVAANSNLVQQKSNRAMLGAKQAALAAASRAVPASKDTPNLLRQLQRTAERSGVSLNVVSPGGAAASKATGAAATPADVDSASLSLTFTGTYAHTQRFLRMLGALVKVSGERVAATGRLMSISAVALTPGAEGKQALTGTVTASVYMLKSAGEVAATAAAAAATAAPTTAAAAP